MTLVTTYSPPKRVPTFSTFTLHPARSAVLPNAVPSASTIESALRSPSDLASALASPVFSTTREDSKTLAAENADWAVLVVKVVFVALTCGLDCWPVISCLALGSQPRTITSVETSATDARGRKEIRFSRSFSETAAPVGAAGWNLYWPFSSQKR